MPPSLDGARRSRRQGVEPATWASRPGSTGASRTPCGRSSRRHGSRQARRGATAFARRAALPTRWGRRRGRSGQAPRGGSISTGRRCSTGRPTTGGGAGSADGCQSGGWARGSTGSGTRACGPWRGAWRPRWRGPRQGGPRAPRRANRRLDERDQARAQRGHRFARAADEANLDGRSRQAGARVMARVTRVLERTRRRTVNEATSAVDRPWNRPGRGVTGARRQPNRRPVRETALTAVQATGRAMPGRTRGRAIRPIGAEWRQRMLGWRAFVGVAEGRSPRRDRDPGIRRRRLQSDPWTPWGRRRDRALRTRGVGWQVAWHPVQSAHGPWRLRQRPARAMARPPRSVAVRELPSLLGP
jgi:hypothetical protein